MQNYYKDGKQRNLGGKNSNKPSKRSCERNIVEVKKADSRVLAAYSLENDVVLYSPESPGEQTYRAVLTEVINNIWEATGEATRAIDQAAESVNNGLAKVYQDTMEQIADTCEYLQPTVQNPHRKSCLYCEHLDAQVYRLPEVRQTRHSVQLALERLSSSIARILEGTSVFNSLIPIQQFADFC